MTNYSYDDALEYLAINGYCTDVEEPLAKEKFLVACEKGWLDIVQYYIEIGMSPNIEHQSFEGVNRPLFKAIQYNQVDTVAFLIQKGALINQIDINGNNAIMHSILWNSHRILELLLKLGGNPNIINKEGWTPISQAIYSKKDNIVNLLLNAPILNVNLTPSPQQACLNYALKAKRIDWILAIVQKGFRLNFPYKESLQDNFAMHIIRHYNFDNFSGSVLQIFINHGLQLEQKNRYGYTLWMFAKYYKKEQFVYFLEQQGAQKKDIRHFNFLHAVKNNQLDKIIHHLKLGVDVNLPTSTGFTALIIAVRLGNIHLVNLLLDAGAQVNQIDSNQWTAISYATNKRQFNIINRLLEVGASPNEKKQHSTALLKACKKNQFAIAKALLEKGAAVNSLNTKGHSPLSIAVSKENIALVQLILKYQPRINQLDQRGNNPLSVAVIKENPALCKLLIQHGADIDSQNNKGETPLFIACDNFKKSDQSLLIVQLLLEAGANYRLGDDIYDTPLAKAKAWKHEKCVNILQRWMSWGEFNKMESLIGSLSSFENQQNFFQEFVKKQDYQNLSVWIRLGEESIVKGLLEAGLNPNPEKSFDDAPLAVACELQNFSLAQELCKYGADPNHQGPNLDSILMRSTSAGLEWLRLFSDHKGDFSIHNRWGSTTLDWAIQQNDLAMIKYAFEAYPMAILQSCPLFWPARKGLLPILSWFIEDICVYIDSRDENGNTPLILAAQERHTKIVRYLVERHADVNAFNHKGETALYFACKYNNLPLIHFLLQYGADPSLEMHGISTINIASNRQDLLNLLLEYVHESINIDQLKIKKLPNITLSPFLKAAYHNNILSIQQLLEQGEDINQVNYRGDTALMIAITRGHLDLSIYLLSEGADFYVKNRLNDNAWVFLNSLGRLRKKQSKEWNTVEEIIKDTKNIRQYDHWQRRLKDAQKAIATAKYKTLNKVLNAGKIDINALSPYYTPLNRAILLRDLDMVKFLLQKGANVNIPSSEGGSPIYLATRNGDLAMMQVLINNGAIINTLKYNALVWAVRFAECPTIELLLQNTHDKIQELKHQEQDLLSLAKNRGDNAVLQILEQYEF